jgi:hypothetical protein
MFFLQFVSGPVGGTLDVLERQDLHLLREIVRLVLLSGAISLAAALDRGPLAAVVFLGSLSYALGAMLAWYAVMKAKGAS